MRLLSAIALLAFACHARAQTNECPQITKEILTTTDESTGSTLVVQAFNPAINPSDPFILVDDIHIVCQAVGETRDTYRSVSVLVRQNCSGFLCPANQPNFNAVIQYDFDCFFGKWRAMDTNVVDSDPEADFDTALRENCGVCSENTVGAEPITHCRPCQSSCTEGAMRCHTTGSGCCTYYFEDMCVENCPLDSHVVDDDFNCVEPVDCPELESPQNGTVTQEERIYPNEAEYSCDDGFELEGEAVRMCQIDGEWTGEAPICEEIPTPTPTPTPPPTTEPPTTIATTEEAGESGISNAELGIVVAVVVLFFIIVAGIFLALVAVWACGNK